MSTYTELTNAQNLIRDRKNWAQGVVKTPDGRRRCAMGALDAVSASGPAYRAMADTAMELYAWPKISTVNDVEGHAAVMACFDLARLRSQFGAWDEDVAAQNERELIPA